jgi:hypothetical protein
MSNIMYRQWQMNEIWLWNNEGMKLKGKNRSTYSSATVFVQIRHGLAWNQLVIPPSGDWPPEAVGL